MQPPSAQYQRCLVVGGARSGKSAYALTRCESLGAPRAYLATAQPGDAEMVERIARHQAARGPQWYTVEEPCEVKAALEEQQGQCAVLLFDCLTLWLSNMMGSGLDDDAILDRFRDVVAALDALPYHVIMVSNEVGWGIVPDHAVARRFRDLAGTANQIAAGALDETVLLVAGQPLWLKAPGQHQT